MIKSAHIKNIRNIQDSFLEFSPNVNIISGESTQGKSATLSSILLPITNKPSGYEYKPFKLKRGEKSSSLINFDDCSVTRERSQSTNKYILNGDEENPFEAMGTEVPEKISSLINIPDYLIHTQHGGYFLIDSKDSPGYVAKEINKICNLEIIDKVTKNINSIVADINSDIKRTKKDIEGKENKLKSLEHIESLCTSVEEIDKLILQQEELEKDIDFLENSLNLVENSEKQIESFKKIIKFENKIQNLLELIEDFEKEENELNNLSKLINNLESWSENNKQINKILSFEQRIKRLLNSIDNYEELLKEINSLNLKNNLILKLESDIINLDSEIIILGEELKNKKDELGYCPLCNNKIGEQNRRTKWGATQKNF